MQREGKCVVSLLDHLASINQSIMEQLLFLTARNPIHHDNNTNRSLSNNSNDVGVEAVPLLSALLVCRGFNVERAREQLTHQHHNNVIKNNKSNQASINPSNNHLNESLHISNSRLSLSDEILQVKLNYNDFSTNSRSAKRQRIVERCSSPSHFYISQLQSYNYSANYQYQLPARKKLDNLLAAVSDNYYWPKSINREDYHKVNVNNDYDKKQYNSLDMLKNPLRRKNIIEDWSNYQLAIFQAGILQYGKDFHEISKLLNHQKTTQQCVEFYYKVWKFSNNYRIWKNPPNNDDSAD
jgi:hypothetical protein